MENALQILERKIETQKLQVELIRKQTEIAKRVSYHSFETSKLRLKKQMDLLVQMKQKYNILLKVMNENKETM